MNIVFDLDGTLADCEHRMHYITGGGPRDWQSFNLACPKDKPIWQTVNLFDALGRDAKNTLAIWTGRGEEVRRETEIWLVEHLGFQYNFCDLKMRAVGDYTEDHILKERWFNEAKNNNFHIHLALDDRARVIEMWRRNGVLAYHVTDGFF